MRVATRPVHKLVPCRCIVLVEQLWVLLIMHHPLAVHRVNCERQIRSQFECFCILAVWTGSVPLIEAIGTLARNPILIKNGVKEVIVPLGWGASPWTFITSCGSVNTLA